VRYLFLHAYDDPNRNRNSRCSSTDGVDLHANFLLACIAILCGGAPQNGAKIYIPQQHHLSTFVVFFFQRFKIYLLVVDTNR